MNIVEPPKDLTRARFLLGRFPSSSSVEPRTSGMPLELLTAAASAAPWCTTENDNVAYAATMRATQIRLERDPEFAERLVASREPILVREILTSQMHAAQAAALLSSLRSESSTPDTSPACSPRFNSEE